MKYPWGISTLAMISVMGLCLLGCGEKRSTDEEKAAALPDLPQSDVDKLKPVPNTHLLATSQVQRAPKPTATTPPPPCIADSIETDYTAQISYPITVCRPLFGLPANDAQAQFYIDSQGPTSKVENSKLPSELQAIAGNAPSARLPIWVCRTDKGPWQGYLTSTYLCIDSCTPVDSLVLTNAPNLYAWSWHGALGQHPPDFQFVGTPVQIDKIDYGRCHTP